MNRFLLAIGLFLSTTSFGQLHSVGFHGGAMGTHVGSDFDTSAAKHRIDFLGGLNYQYRFPHAWTIGVNIEYTQYGARVFETFYNQFSQEFLGSGYSSYDWNYISIPIIGGYEVGGKIMFKPKIALIPSILQRAVYNHKPYEGSTLQPYKTSNYSDARKIDLAGMLGFDVSARFHSGVIFMAVDARYSITTLNADNYFPTSSYNSMRNFGISASLGVRFNLGMPEGDGPTDIYDDPIE